MFGEKIKKRWLLGAISIIIGISILLNEKEKSDEK